MNKGRFSISPLALLLGALLYCTASFSEEWQAKRFLY